MAALAMPVAVASAAILQGLILQSELEAARQLLDPLLAHLLQRRADGDGGGGATATDAAAAGPLPLLCCHVRVLQLALLDAEGRLRAAAASLPAVRTAVEEVRNAPANAPGAPHAGWASPAALWYRRSRWSASLTSTTRAARSSA